MPVFYRLSLLAFLTCLTLSVWAQQTVVTGQIVDAATGQPLAYASVRFPGSAFGGRADSLGRFRVSAVGNFSEVSFSLVGYEPLTKVILPGQVNKLQVLLVAKELAGVTI